MPRVLIAEDAQYVQYLLKQVLQDQGHQVLTALDGYETIRQINAHHIDLLLLDLHLPGLDGLQVVAEAHKKWPKMPYLVISGYVDEELESKLLAQGAARILRKPVDNQTLVQAVREESEPARRICVLSEDPDGLKPFLKKLDDLGYQAESLWRFDLAQSRILHRAFHAVVVWIPPGNEGLRMTTEDLCRNLRQKDEWVPVFIPRWAMTDTLQRLEIQPIASENPDSDLLYTRLADTIGLQRSTDLDSAVVIQLAGSIDRDDVLAAEIHSALTQRKNILFDVRQMKYAGPYVKKHLEEVFLKAEELHLKTGFLVSSGAATLPLEEWTARMGEQVMVFDNQSQAFQTIAGRGAQGKIR